LELARIIWLQLQVRFFFVWFFFGDSTSILLDDGKLYTWGRSTHGQLGSENRKSDFGVPKQVISLDHEVVVSVSCGENHTLALTKDGQVFGFGFGRNYALGLGPSKEDQKIPKLITFNPSVEIKQALAGNGFSLFLDADGKVYSCGSSEYGRLGHGRGDLFEKVPRLIRGLSGVKIVQIALGEYHAAALSARGKIYSWGFGKDGQTGSGTTMNLDIPRQVITNLQEKKIVQVSCGGGHTGVLTDDGDLLLWGRGRSGQLGRGDKLESVAAYRTEPLRVEFFHTNALKIAQISLGADHSAAIVEQ
jgi:alpha-tubulin suppressor-like RCC1 family protein